MIEVVINYRSRWQKKTAFCQLPESWAEMQLEDIHFAISCIYKYAPEYALTLILIRLLNIKPHIAKKLSVEQLVDLIKPLSWIRIDEYEKPPFDRFTHRKQIYFMPSETMKNASANEYALADEVFSKYLESKEKSDLLLLAGILCRPPKKSLLQVRKTGDIRVPIVDIEEAKYRAKLFEDLDEEILGVILLFFAGCRRHIHKLYEYWIFKSPPKEGEEDQEEPVEENGHLFGWWSVYMDTAKTGIFGNFDQVLQTNFHQVCMYLVQEKKNHLIEKEQMDKARRKHKQAI